VAEQGANMHNVVMMSRSGQAADPGALDLARMLGLSPTAFSYWDRDLQCRYANAAFSDWFGIDPEILVGSSLEGMLEILRLDAHFELAEAALHGEHRSIVHSFHAGAARCDGLVQYIPDVRGHLFNGLLIQVSQTPPVPRLSRFCK
jgi:PAS domain-containing protein